MNPAKDSSADEGYMPTSAEATHDISQEDLPSVELDLDNSPLVAMLNRIHHLPAPSGQLIMKVRLKGKEEYAVREVDSGGVFAYNCEDTRMVIPVCKSLDDLPTRKDDRYDAICKRIRLNKKHYEA